MSIHIKIFDDEKTLIEKFKFPQELSKALKDYKTQNDYYVEFYSIDDGKLKVLYSSEEKTPRYNPEKDKIFLLIDLFWNDYDYMLEEIFDEYSKVLKEKGFDCVEAYTHCGSKDEMKEAIGYFKEVFKDALHPYVMCLLMDETIINDWAHGTAERSATKQIL